MRTNFNDRSLTLTAWNRRSVIIAAVGVTAAVGIVLSLRAQTPKPAADSTAVDRAPCETLRKHGDPGEIACWGRLSKSTNLAIRAEGLWGLKDYKGAAETFKAAVAARPKDANLKVRFGLLEFEAPMGKPSLGDDQFKAALEIDEKNAQALLGLAKVAEEDFGPDASKFAEEALVADPKLYEARELMARVALEDNMRTRPLPKPIKPWRCRPRLWRRWRFWLRWTG